MDIRSLTVIQTILSEGELSEGGTAPELLPVHDHVSGQKAGERAFPAAL